jgi:GH43 family beta-xylosidase
LTRFFYKVSHKIVAVFTVVLFVGVCADAQKKTFTNPVLPSGADPWVMQHDGNYYYTNSTGNNITIWKTRNIIDLQHAEKKVVWVPPTNASYSKEIWAPELHFIDKKWYIYFAADDGNNSHHRIYVLENNSADPLEGKWIFKGKVYDPADKWAIDASVFMNRRQLYMIWSGWQGDTNGEQDIFIAKLKNPWTVDGERVKLSYPVFGWEKNGDLHDASNPPHVNVNEGPEMLKHGNKLFLIYSASGCWTDYYALGMLSTTDDKDLLNPKSWTKSSQPVFKQSPENGVYAPGHNSFFKSPDGKEDWILYHANSAPGQGCGKDRSPRAQKFTWNKDGSPNFGTPVKTNQEIPMPSGTK